MPRTSGAAAGAAAVAAALALAAVEDCGVHAASRYTPASTPINLELIF
jgi:hypothetical protein